MIQRQQILKVIIMTKDIEENIILEEFENEFSFKKISQI